MAGSLSRWHPPQKATPALVWCWRSPAARLSAWVGLVFHDRNAAFDFYLKFDEYFEKREKKNEEFKIDTNVDFSLKTGKKLIFYFNL